MSISPNLTHCTDIKLYHFQCFNHTRITLDVVEPGLSAVVFIDAPSSIDYLGGALEYGGVAGYFWVDIINVQDEWIIGEMPEGHSFYRTGSRIHFKPEHIMKLSGNTDWQIRNLWVMVSERVIYNGEKVGYYYNYGMEEQDPFLLARNYYAESETHAPKSDIRLVKIPLSYLVDYDPLVAQFLDVVSIDGVIRTEDDTFEPYLVEPRDTNAYPRGYIADWEEEDDIIEDDSDLPF